MGCNFGMEQDRIAQGQFWIESATHSLEFKMLLIIMMWEAFLTTHSKAICFGTSFSMFTPLRKTRRLTFSPRNPVRLTDFQFLCDQTENLWVKPVLTPVQKSGPLFFCIPLKGFRSPLACLYRTLGQAIMMPIRGYSPDFPYQLFSTFGPIIKELFLWQYQVRIWACSGTTSYPKVSWAVVDLKCPTFFEDSFKKLFVLRFVFP